MCTDQSNLQIKEKTKEIDVIMMMVEVTLIEKLYYLNLVVNC